MSERDNESCEVGSREYYEKALNKNVEYYIKAFKRLDETGKHTWNWAAFLFEPGWLFYRKMYISGFFTVMIMKFFEGMEKSLEHLMGDKSEILIGFLFLGINLLWGYFGNAWYYDK